MVVVDRNLIITSVNDAALKTMGYHRDEVVGKMTCAEFQKTLLCGTASCTLKNCMRTGETIVGDTHRANQGRKKVPNQGRLFAYCGPAGKHTGRH